jgi:chemotaxis family two-component system sensor kinase Cph1
MIEGFADYAEVASGCLAVRLDPQRRDVLLWLRPEQVRTVTWGGDPRKPVATGSPEAPRRLHPRTSFAAWQEQVYQRSRDWTIEDRAAAQAIQQHLRLVVHRVYEVKRALQRSNRELTEFAHAASHDLQEPLRTIAGCCEHLAKHLKVHVEACGQPLSASITQFLSLAQDGAKRGKALVADLLDFAQLEHAAPAMERVLLDAALADATAALAQTIADNGARIQAEPLPPVMGNRRQLTQLLQNLIGNAIKYRGTATPEVRVSALRRAGGWQLTVADNGIGIRPEDHERIFTIFTRLHGRSHYPGTGVGLALCRKIATLHGGRIWVESEAGRGSAFHVVLADPEQAHG